jgi:uncharacterized cupin superfamily protein
VTVTGETVTDSRKGTELTEEARLEDGPSGRIPATAGWFVLNVRDAAWMRHENFGAGARFEGPDAHFDALGINVRVLQPGQPNALYHAESGQEDFLVLMGECLLLVEGEERRLQAWDLVHLPPGTEHVVVGAGAGPCVVLMAGARSEEESIVYPASELARRHGAGVETETTSAAEAYAPFPRVKLERPDDWEALPWA